MRARAQAAFLPHEAILKMILLGRVDAGSLLTEELPPAQGCSVSLICRELTLLGKPLAGL